RVFECTATIDDVVHDSPWYRAKISVYDNSEQAILYYSAMLVANRPGRRHRVSQNYFEEVTSYKRDQDPLFGHSPALTKPRSEPTLLQLPRKHFVGMLCLQLPKAVWNLQMRGLRGVRVLRCRKLNAKCGN
ncbi:hypothetical protein Bca52824_067963, partial [Brassica carinata]